MAVGREEVVGGAVPAPTSAAGELADVVPLAGVAAFGAGPVVVGQTPFLGAAGQSRMKAKRGGSGDVDGSVRAGGLIVRGRALAGTGADEFQPSSKRNRPGTWMAAGTDEDAFGGQAEGVFGVVRRVDVDDALDAGAVELIKEDGSVVSGIEDGGDDVHIGIVRAKVTVGE